MLRCSRGYAQEAVRHGIDKHTDVPLKLWSDFDSKPKALFCLPHSLLYGKGEELRLPCCRCRRSRTLVYGSLLYQYEAAAG